MSGDLRQDIITKAVNPTHNVNITIDHSKLPNNPAGYLGEVVKKKKRGGDL